MAQVLVQMFAKEEETTIDLTAAEEQMPGINFDLFKEKISCQVTKGIKLSDMEKLSRTSQGGCKFLTISRKVYWSDTILTRTMRTSLNLSSL